jgi:two-component sensor histidine kinase
MADDFDLTARERGDSTLGIADITITPELWARPARPANLEAEAAAIRHLADVMATDPSKIFQLCVDLAVELCRADTSGISLYERTDAGEDVFRWIAMAGQLKQHLHGTTPRHFSPCGISVDSGMPLLMRRPELVYGYLDVGPPFHDVLLIPLGEKGSRLEGTIWIVAHDPTRKFDGEDARLMQRLAIFTATALQMAQVVEKARADAAEQRLRFQELGHRVSNTLQMTSSMLRLQLGSVADPAARTAIETASRRVLAMGQMHRIGAGAARGDLAEVIESVCADLFGTAGTPFRFKLEAENVIVPAHKAAVVALIVNELATNAIKHGFGDRASGTVTIGLRRTGADSVALSVADDGVPLPTNVDNERPDGIGLNLVRRLADQLAGELVVDAEPKRFIVVFPADGAHHQRVATKSPLSTQA